MRVENGKLRAAGGLFLAVGAAVLLFCHTGVAAEVATESYEWNSVAIGADGFINGVVYGRAEGSPCYINTDMGGAYRLDGDTWQCLTDWIRHDDWSLNAMGVETLALDPTNPDKVYLALGTYLGPSAIVRSNDRGRTFQRTNVDFPMNGNGAGRNSGQRMNVDPNWPARLLYGTRNRGLYESVDGAVSWRRVTAFPTDGERVKPGKDVGLVWTLFDPASGPPGAPTPVAYVGNCTVSPLKILRTTDAGKTWQPISGQPGGALLPMRAALARDGKTLFATFVIAKDMPGPAGIDGGAIWRCDDPAGTAPVWTDITPTLAGKSGWSGVCLSTDESPVLYVSTMDHYSNGGDDLFRSRDGGKTWLPLHIGQHLDNGPYPYLRDARPHWTGDVEVNPRDPDEAIFTTGYGLYRTTTLRTDAPTWIFFNRGFEQSAVRELRSPRTGAAHLLSAIGDRDGFRHEDFRVSPRYGRFGQRNDFGQTTNLSMGTCAALDVASDQPDVCVRVGAGAQYSEDGGITWQTFANTPARNEFDEIEHGSRGPSGGTVAVAADGSSVVWAPRQAKAMLATREGHGWTPWSDVAGLPPSGSVDVVADPASSATFYAYVGGDLFVSTDGGKTFVRRGAAPAGGFRMRAMPGRRGDLWIACGERGAGLQHSTDGGQSWTRVAPDTVTTAKQVGLGAPPPGRDDPAVFVGGTVGGLAGFFRSDDAGKTWVRINDDAHQYGNVTVINGDSRVFGRLYVGTNGRGIVYGDRTDGSEPTH